MHTRHNIHRGLVALHAAIAPCAAELERTLLSLLGTDEASVHGTLSFPSVDDRSPPIVDQAKAAISNRAEGIHLRYRCDAIVVKGAAALAASVTDRPFDATFDEIIVTLEGVPNWARHILSHKDDGSMLPSPFGPLLSRLRAAASRQAALNEARRRGVSLEMLGDGTPPIPLPGPGFEGGIKTLELMRELADSVISADRKHIDEYEKGYQLARAIFGSDSRLTRLLFGLTR